MRQPWSHLRPRLSLSSPKRKISPFHAAHFGAAFVCQSSPIFLSFHDVNISKYERIWVIYFSSLGGNRLFRQSVRLISESLFCANRRFSKNGKERQAHASRPFPALGFMEMEMEDNGKSKADLFSTNIGRKTLRQRLIGLCQSQNPDHSSNVYGLIWRTTSRMVPSRASSTATTLSSN